MNTKSGPKDGCKGRAVKKMGIGGKGTEHRKMEEKPELDVHSN